MSMSKEELLASLNFSSSSPNLPVAETIGSVMSLADLEKECAALSNPSPGPTRANKPIRLKSNPNRLSITGRPEEFYKTVRKKNGRGESLLVGNYQMGEKLGKGAFGVVYKGLDMKTGQFVAVKRIDKSAVNQRTMMKEINFLKTFNHPNIVSYVTLLQTEKHVNLVLEFVDSGSLSQVLAGYGFFPESLAAIYTEQVLKGLDYLHQRNVIHRDIKGGNILITRDGAIKLADFGIATVASSNPRHSLVEGSPYWMAPEAIEMNEAPTTKSDIWSLGCTLIELITGVPPYFEMVSVSACFRMVSDDHPPLPTDISKELKDFLLCCFKRPAKARPSATDLLNHPWIQKHVQATNKPKDLEQVKRTIKRYTLGKESSSLQQDLSNLNFDAETFEEAVNTPPVKPKTRTNKTRSGTWNAGKIKDKKPSLSLTIYSVETRRSLFTYTIYHVKVVKNINDKEETYNIERTWSDFKEMHTCLQVEFPQLNIPSCPERKYWGVMQPEFVKKRWQELQDMVNAIIDIPQLGKSAPFIKFYSK